MNRIERFIYDRVKHNPRLKRAIVDTYQRIFLLIPIKKIESQYPIRIRKGYFYGFHDKCPWSPDNSMLLAHKFTNPLNMPGISDEIAVGYFTGKQYSKFNEIGRTKTWNWQTGSMLQWVGNTSRIIFNDFDGEKHISRMVTTEGNTVKLFDRSIAAISPNGKLALSYSFARLREHGPAYGYANGHDPGETDFVPKEDGLFLIEIDSGEIKKLFSVADIAQIDPEPSMENAYHFFTHCLFSPSNVRFVFFHRWLLKNGQTWTRMLSCDTEGNSLHIFPTSGTVTHIAWKDDTTILAYSLIKGFGDHYYLFSDKTNQFTIFGEYQFSSDGHPQFSFDRKRIVTDTYPDRFRRQFLIIYDIDKKERVNVLIVRSPMKYRSEIRCDLHPRWNRDSTMICFDSAHTGTRSLCTIKL